jgi:hypothetical protein
MMIRLLKNTHLLRCAHPPSLQRTVKYASFLVIPRALHLNVFDQPVKNYFLNKRLGRLYAIKILRTLLLFVYSPC